MTLLSIEKTLNCIFTDCFPGIRYWATVCDFHDTFDDDGATDYFASIDDDEDDGKHYRIDRDAILAGLELAASPGMRYSVGWSTGDPPPWPLTAEALDAWDYDASDADMVVQFALFGDVIYG